MWPYRLLGCVWYCGVGDSVVMVEVVIYDRREVVEGEILIGEGC